MFQNIFNKFSNKDALILMGGPSVLEYIDNLKNFDRKRFTLFIETKALTPKVFSYGIQPDFFLAPFPEKCKDNTIQHFIYRSFLADVNIRSCLKPIYNADVDEMKSNFNKYFEVWRPHKGKHKQFRYKKDIYLNNSPYNILSHFPKVNIITNKKSLKEHFPKFNYPNPIYSFVYSEKSNEFDADRYFNPSLKNDELVIENNLFLNSVAIATYPIIKAMGFRRVYLLGMDMNMFGSLEYAVPFVFKSMLHFWWFFIRANRVFNADYKMNKPYYFRPESEFIDLKKIIKFSKMDLIRVYKPNKYVAPIEGMKTIRPEDLFN